MKNRIVIGALLCLVASASWGAMFPVANDAFYHIDPFYFTIFRYIAVTMILVVLLLWKEGVRAFRFEGKGLTLWFFGTMAFLVYNVLIFWGQDLLGEQGIMVASVMESLMPMASVVLLWIFSRKKPHAVTLLCIGIAFIGVTLVITKGDVQALFNVNELIPSLLIFVAIIGWAVYSFGGERFSGWSVLRYSTLTCLLGTMTAVAVVLAVTATGYVTVPTVETIKMVSPHLLFMMIFPGLIALLGWNFGISILSPINGILFINFVPVTTLIVSMVQGYQITSFDLIGTILIITALVSNNLFLRWTRKRDEAVQMKGQMQETVA